MIIAFSLMIYDFLTHINHASLISLPHTLKSASTSEYILNNDIILINLLFLHIFVSDLSYNCHNSVNYQYVNFVDRCYPANG